LNSSTIYLTKEEYNKGKAKDRIWRLDRGWGWGE
jgi:hypothetical protein